MQKEHHGSIGKLDLDVFGGQTYACDSQVNSICEGLSGDLRISANVDVVTVELGADTLNSVDGYHNLRLLRIRVQELKRDWLKHQVLAILANSGSVEFDIITYDGAAGR